MRLALVFGTGIALLLSAAASADPLNGVFEPAASVRVGFGGRVPADFAIALRMNYSERVQRELASAVPVAAADSGESHFKALLPAAAEWSYVSTGTHAVRMNGLTLGSGDLRLNEAEETGDRSSFWGGNVGLMVLATGAAIAGIVAAAGDAAEDNNPAVNPPENPEAGGGDTCINIGPIGGVCDSDL